MRLLSERPPDALWEFLKFAGGEAPSWAAKRLYYVRKIALTLFGRFIDLFYPHVSLSLP